MCEILLKKLVTLCREPVVIDLLISPLCPALCDECNYYVPLFILFNPVFITVGCRILTVVNTSLSSRAVLTFFKHAIVQPLLNMHYINIIYKTELRAQHDNIHRVLRNFEGRGWRMLHEGNTQEVM